MQHHRSPATTPRIAVDDNFRQRGDTNPCCVRKFRYVRMFPKKVSFLEEEEIFILSPVDVGSTVKSCEARRGMPLEGVHARVRACVRACVRVCVCLYVCVSCVFYFHLFSFLLPSYAFPFIFMIRQPGKGSGRPTTETALDTTTVLKGTTVVSLRSAMDELYESRLVCFLLM